jgi:hypothetical protein
VQLDPKSGAVVVDEAFRTSAESVYAVGDHNVSSQCHVGPPRERLRGGRPQRASTVTEWIGCRGEGIAGFSGTS